MTERFFCDECKEFGYVFSDGSNIEVIESCKCPKLIMMGEI